MKPTPHPLVILLVCAFLTVCTWAATPKGAAEKTKITISVEQITAASAITKISNLAAVTAHYTIPAQEKDAVLTLQLTDASAAEAFEYVAKLAGLSLRWDQDGAHFSRPPREVR